MRIESLTPPLEETKPWRVMLEDGSSLQLDAGEVLRFSLYAGMDVDELLLEQLTSAQTMGTLRQRAMSMLMRRSLSRGELLDRLREKGATPQQAEDVCAWVESIGLLNDESYAATVVKHCVQRGYGIYRARDELYKHKIPKELWDAALEELPEPEEEIDRFLEKNLRDDTPQAVKKAANALARRGFSWGAVSAGIRRRGMAED